jgi:hypothetical protein
MTRAMTNSNSTSGAVSAARHGLALAALLALAACQSSPSQTQDTVKAMEPQAMAAAEERATTDLNCGAITTQVLSSEHGNLGDPYGLRRVVYRVQATGCGMRVNYSVACSVKSVCSALSEGGMVERVKP